MTDTIGSEYNSNLYIQQKNINEYVIIGGVLLFLSPALLLLIDFKPLLAISYFTFVTAFLLFTQPKLSFALFLISISVFAPYKLGLIAIHPFDIVFLIALIAMFFDFLLRATSKIRSTYLDTAFLFLIGATWLSALFAYNKELAIVPSIRIVFVYLAFRIIFKYALEVGVRKLLVIFMIQTALLSLIAFIQFVLSGGTIRSFGITGLTLQYFAIAALPMMLVFIIWSRSFSGRIFYGMLSLLTGLGILASQSRAPLVAIVIVIPLLLFLVYKKGIRENNRHTVRAVKSIFIPLILLVAIVTMGETLFGGTLSRIQELIESIQHPQGTVALRLVLWSSAIKGFSTSPFVGIGIGNMHVLHEVVPEIRLEPLWIWVKGYSAHNVILHYLAETGLIGTTALFLLFWKNLQVGYRSYKKVMNHKNNQVSTALFISALVCFITMFFMRSWTWGQTSYVLAFLFGLNNAWAYQNYNIDD